MQRWELLDDDADLRRTDALREPLDVEPDNALVLRPIAAAADADGDVNVTWL